MKKSTIKKSNRIKKRNEKQRKRTKNVKKKSYCKPGGSNEKNCAKDNNALYKTNGKYGNLFDGWFKTIRTPLDRIAKKNPYLGSILIIAIIISVVLIVKIIADATSNETEISNVIRLSILSLILFKFK